jgi:hypothetical protein
MLASGWLAAQDPVPVKRPLHYSALYHTRFSARILTCPLKLKLNLVFPYRASLLLHATRTVKVICIKDKHLVGSSFLSHSIDLMQAFLR